VVSRRWRWGLSAVVAVVLALVVRNHYVLDSNKLDAAIKAELLPGTPKSQVVKFIQEWKPQFCEDLGTHVKARIAGRAGNLIYRKDVTLDFEFDSNGRMLSYSEKVYLSFI
jgi:hypothetical protein